MSPTWLERFSEAQIIRRRGVVDHVACRDAKTGERRLVIATKEARLRELFDSIARLHGELSHPNIPALDHRGRAAGVEYVALRSAAFVDLETMLPIAIANHGFAPGATVAFLDAVIGAVRTAHAKHICIGAFGGSNVVVSESHIDVIGWGYPTTEADRRTVLDDSSVMYTAWEASFGTRRVTERRSRRGRSVPRRDAPGESISPDGLLAAGWPGEQVSAEAGRNRVRVAVSTLRSMGLRDVLLSRDDGYLLDPDVGLRLD